MSIAVCIVAGLSSFWIDYGWQPLSGGGHEYILQVSPEDIDALRIEGIESYVPPEVRDIRRIRITVGTERIPQDLNPTASLVEEAANGSDETSAGQSQNAESRTAKYPDPLENERTNSTASPTDGQRGFTAWLSSNGMDPIVLTQIGLGVAAAAMIFLAWAHLSMRRRYRALLHRTHSQ